MKKQEVNNLRSQIAQLRTQGMTVSQIARELNVSRPTVYSARSHRRLEIRESRHNSCRLPKAHSGRDASLRECNP